MMWGYMSSFWCSLHWYETTHYPCRSALCPRTTCTQQGNQQHISSAITLSSCICLFFVPRHPMMDSNNLLDPLCHAKWSNQESNTEWSPNMNQICILIHLHEHQYSRLGVVCALLLAPIPIWKMDVTITSDRYRQDFAFGWGHILVTWQADIFHSYMGRYQWPLERHGSLFPINNCSSRSSSHS